MPDICTNPLLKGRNKRVYIIDQHLGLPIPSSGLIHEVLMNGNALDTSGNGNDGVVTLATLETGKDGAPNTAYEFTGGTLSRIVYGDPVELRDIPGNDFTFSIWVNDYLTNSTDYRTVWSSWTSGNAGMLVRTYGSAAETDRRAAFYVYYTTSFCIVESSNFPIINGQFNHYLVTFNATTKNAQIYINGTEISYTSQTAGVGTLKSDSGVSKRHGALTESISSQTLDGKLSLHRIYDRILTSEEIAILANE